MECRHERADYLSRGSNVSRVVVQLKLTLDSTQQVLSSGPVRMEKCVSPKATGYLRMICGGATDALLVRVDMTSHFVSLRLVSFKGNL